MLKRLYGLLLASVLIPTAAWAQGDPMSSKEMVAITPVVCEGAELPADADRALMMKMNQMVTANGMGASSLRYALVPNVVVVDKQTTGTVPVQFIVSLEVSFYVLDVTELWLKPLSLLGELIVWKTRPLSGQSIRSPLVLLR